ncbi:MAG: hypothetical protein ACJAUG_003443 [Halioglobus sp.]
MFLAQVYAIDLSWSSMALVATMAVAASIVSPAMPAAQNQRDAEASKFSNFTYLYLNQCIIGY